MVDATKLTIQNTWLMLQIQHLLFIKSILSIVSYPEHLRHHLNPAFRTIPHIQERATWPTGTPTNKIHQKNELGPGQSPKPNLNFKNQGTKLKLNLMKLNTLLQREIIPWMKRLHWAQLSNILPSGDFWKADTICPWTILRAQFQATQIKW